MSRQQPTAEIRARLLNRGAYRWYLGTTFGLVYQAYEVVYLWTSNGSLGFKLLGTLLLTVFYFAFIVLPPLVWPQSVRTRILALGVYWGATSVLLPFIGVFLIWVWTLVVAMIAFTWLPVLPSIVMTAVIADLRAAVSSYREMNLGSELTAARTALDAAGIQPHLPADGSATDEGLRSLFGWALREGVTNVIRHSNATECWVELTRSAIGKTGARNAPDAARIAAENGWLLA